jgi:Rieske 2Fe-2S family protein
MHRDSEPGKTLTVPHSISLDPRGNKRFVLTDPQRERLVPVESRAYWFNDMDYHGVEADPFFRYSIRVDGVFDSKWLSGLRRRLGG